jgi:uncharacterized membrane protein
LSDPVARDIAALESDRLHKRVQLVLRAGLLTSVVLMVTGLALRFARGESDAPAVGLIELFTRGGDVGLLLTAFGILVLALTPALRVLALVGVWWHERDYRFVGVALIVVATLITSVLIGKGG